jgi:hypothetical protein
MGAFDKTNPRGTPTCLPTMPIPEPASPTPIADAAAVATLLLSRGKYFIASKVDKSIAPESGQAPFSVNFAGVVRDRTPDSRLFLVDIFGVAEDFETPESTVAGHRVMSLEELLNATFFPDFTTMQDQAAVNTGLFESLNVS